MNLQHERIAALCQALKLDRIADHYRMLAPHGLLSGDQDAGRVRLRLQSRSTEGSAARTGGAGFYRADGEHRLDRSFRNRQNPFGHRLGVSGCTNRLQDTLCHCGRSDAATGLRATAGALEGIFQPGRPWISMRLAICRSVVRRRICSFRCR